MCKCCVIVTGSGYLVKSVVCKCCVIVTGSGYLV